MTRKLATFLLALAMSTLAFTPLAHASDPCAPLNQATIDIEVTGDCTVSGSLVATSGSVTLITHGGKATVTGQISATGNVTVTGDTGISIGSISSGGQLNIVSSTGAISLQGTSTSTGGALFLANNDVSLQGVNNNSTGYSEVRIFANQGGSGTDQFKIGTGAAANGALYVYNEGDVDGRTIYVTNGNSAGIAYAGSSTLNANATNGTGGTIILDGKTFGVTLSGTLSVDGTSGKTPGAIDIFAQSVTSNGATLSSNTTAAVTAGVINLITDAVTANSGGLTIKLGGTGPGPGNVDLSLNPVGSYSVSVPTNLSQPITFGNYLGSAQPLAITGAGGLIITVTGAQNGIKIWGYPLTLTTATTTFTMTGSQHTTTIDSWDGNSTENVLTLGGTIAVHVNNTAVSHTPGSIEMSGSSVTTASLGNVLLDVSATTNGSGGSIDFEAGTMSTLAIGTGSGQFAFSAKGGSTQGNAGQVTINAASANTTITTGTPINLTVVKGVGGQINLTAKSLTDSGQGASLIADGNGAKVGSVTSDGGTIDLTLTGNLLLGPSAGGITTLSPSANGIGKGGTIVINDSGNSVTIGGNILANAATTGTDTVNGGTVDIENASSLTLGGNVSANAAGNGIAQSITLSGGTLTFENPTHEKFTATGAGTGAGGNISITQSNSTEILSLNYLTVSASASSTGTGNAGTIQATNSQGAITVVESTISAQAFGSGGNGGSVSFTQAGTPATNHPIDLTATAAPINVSANQTNGGLGGTVVVNHGAASWDVETNTARTLDVNLFVTVSGGPGAASDGTINLNGIACQQWPLTSTPFPVSYWDCVNPTSPMPSEEYPGDLAGSSLTATLKSLLGTPVAGMTSDQLYVFKDASTASTFFTLSPTQLTTNAGFTFNLAGGHTYVNPFQKATLPVGGYKSLVEEQINETTAHELGHGVDYTAGQNNQSNNPTFVTGAVNDFIQLDFSVVGTVGNRTLRPPCSTTNTAPFDGVVDLSTGKQFCSAGKLVAAKYKTMTNSLIMATSAPGIFPTSPVSYYELYAQAFAYQLYVYPAQVGAANSFVTTANGVFANAVASQTFNYFACTQTWVINEIQSSTLTPPTYCAGPTSFYLPYQTLSYWTTH